MENPCLTFVTPTLLAGDKSLADVVRHMMIWMIVNKTDTRLSLYYLCT